MAPLIPGELMPEPGHLELNAGQPVTTLTVANTGDRPVQVGSHFHFHDPGGRLCLNADGFLCVFWCLGRSGSGDGLCGLVGGSGRGFCPNLNFDFDFGHRLLVQLHEDGVVLRCSRG